MKNNLSTNNQGFTIVEIIVVIMIIVTAFFVIVGFFILDAKVTERSQMRLKAISLARESIETLRNFRDNTKWDSTGIGTLTAGVNYHINTSSTGWEFFPGEESINEFSRTIVLNRVSRGANDNIETTYNPDNDDPKTRKVIVDVNWSDRQGSASERLKTYITNWKK